MDPLNAGIIGCIALVACFFLGIPIGYSLGIVGFSGLTYLFGFEAAVTFSLRRLHDFLASFTFTAIPLFVLMGYFALYSDMTKDAFTTARMWLSRIPGGLASAVVVASALFAACSGTGIPAAAALGRISVPEMLEHKYDRRLATGVVAAATPLAVLIPPSITMIIYGILTETSIARLLIAGIIPGILASIVFIVGITLRAWRNPTLAPAYSGEVSWALRLKELRKILGIVFLFFLVIGSIYLGLATPTEAAGFGAFGTLLLGIARRRLGWAEVKRSLYDSVMVCSTIFMIIGMASIFNVFLTRTGVITSLGTFLVNLNLSPMGMLVVMSVFYIILGCFLDSISMMIITIPIIYPLLTAMNIDLVWFGVIMTIYIEIASITPPFGITVYALKGALGDLIDLWDIFRGCFFFFWMWIIILAIILLFPRLSLWLPALVKG
jgi:tripartite ATP-independent transporter DctM subunit